MLGQHNTAFAQDIKRAGNKSFAPAGAFEAVCRDVQARGRADIYARYVGDSAG